MSPSKTNASASESIRQRKSSSQKDRKKPFRQRKIPKTLEGVPVLIYGAKVDDFVNGDATIQPIANVVSASESTHVTTPQDTVNLGPSYFQQADPVHSQIPQSTRVYGGAEPPQFQYGPDPNVQAEDIFPFTNTGNPCQSYGRYDPSCYIFPPSTGSLGMEHGVEPYQQWPDPYSIPQSCASNHSNVSSTFPGNSENDFFEFTGSHLPMMDGNTLPFPTYDATGNNLHGSFYM